MKRLILTFLSALIFSSASYASDVLEFNVTGSIGVATCDVKNADQTHDLGLWLVSDTANVKPGATWTSTAVPYTLDFDCPAGQKIALQLSGNQYDAGNEFYIGLDKTDDTAEGIVVVMHYFAEDSRWISVVYNRAVVPISMTVAGTNTIKLRSFYRTIGQAVKPGTANATVTVNVSYQ
ncbi:fimbrial protein [Orbus wheelerorum]|uniref:fimbrial protein n=1 Tax=Orbus wheelerorum TaxID=3074111 RepID=UPI00370D1634